MKLFVLLLSISLATYAVEGRAQQITINVKSQPLAKVLDAIYKQSGYNVIAEPRLLNLAKPVTLKATNQPLAEVLERCFVNQPITYVLSAKDNAIVVRERHSTHLVISNGEERAGEISHLILAYPEVRGRVVDSLGRPLQGASVRVLNAAGKRTTLQTLTDHDGYFLLTNVPEDATLEISYVGHVTITIKAIAETGRVVLKAVTSELGEVEVSLNTGFQYIPKERATGAFSYIDNETFNEQVSMDVLSRLEAVTSGLDIARTTVLGPEQGIRIRGISTFTAGTIRDPLIILDDFPYEGKLDNINPNDVESVTLLKDAAAASIWGARAGNGVIVITTKRGRRNQPLRIDFNSNVTVGSKPDFSFLPIMEAVDYIGLERFLFAQEHRFSDTASIRHPPFSPAYEVMFRQLRGEISNTEAQGMLAALESSDVAHQYLQHIYEPSVNQQYALNLRGGNNNTAWYFSTGYDRNKSTLGALSNRFNVNFHNTYTPFKSLQVQVRLTHTQSQAVGGRTGLSSRAIPYTQIADTEGNRLPVMKDYRQSFLDTVGGGRLLDWNYYPLTDDNYIDNRSSVNHTLFNIGINHKPFNWLTLDVKYQYGRQQTRNDLTNSEGSYFTNDLINRFSQLSPTTGEVVYVVPRGSILDVSRGYMKTHNLRGQINVNKTWHTHELMALVGAEASHRGTKAESYRTYGYNPDILTFGTVDYLSQYPDFITGSNSFVPKNQNFSDQTARFVSAYANAAYTYASKYTFSLSGRRDASNQFGVKFNDRWNLLWSAGLSWEVSREAFYRLEALPYLRFRGTYGFSGNTDMSRSAVTTIQYLGTANYLLTPYAAISQNANPELGWERIRMLNMAMDFRLKGNRISGSFDLFYKYGSGLFGPEPIDATTGISPIVTRNASSIRGWGSDIELNSLNIDRALKWTTNLNLSYYTDEVVESYRPNLNASSHVLEGGFNRIVGEPMHMLYSYRWGGLDPTNGDPIGFIGGEPSKNYSSILGAGAQMVDLVNHGSAIPVVYGSIGNTFSYRNFGLTIRLLYKMGYFFRDDAVRYNSLFAGNGGGQHPEYSRRWHEPGDEVYTNVPAMAYPGSAVRDNFYRLSEVKVERGDNVRLQYINFNYQLEKGRFPSLPFQNITLYVNAANLGILWKATDVHVDPLYGAGALPPAPTYSFGLRFEL